MAEEISTCFQREMSGIQELNLGARYIFPERFRSSGNEERIVFAPDRKQRRFGRKRCHRRRPVRCMQILQSHCLQGLTLSC